ncbi:hypothetical protein [Oricola indica]|uniref:hypothetical protein n=1 Tax=Oricola indica TaxID=2872591 RepID=UPI003CCBFAA5
MRRILLSTVSVASLVALAACSDDVAQNGAEQDPVATEQSAEVDTTIPTTDDDAGTMADAGQTDENALPGDTDMQADAGTDTDVTIDEQMTAATGADETGADAVEEVRQSVADARDAIETQSEAASVQALIQVERAVDNLDDPKDAQEAVDTARNAVVTGDFEAALAALSDVEMAAEAGMQTGAVMEPSDETTASTTQ